MARNRRILLAAVVGAGSVALFLATERGRFRLSLPRVRVPLEPVREQLAAIERQVEEISAQVGELLSDAAQQIAQPGAPEEPVDDWRLSKQDVDEDLPRLRGEV